MYCVSSIFVSTECRKKNVVKKNKKQNNFHLFSCDFFGRFNRFSTFRICNVHSHFAYTHTNIQIHTRTHVNTCVCVHDIQNLILIHCHLIQFILN